MSKRTIGWTMTLLCAAVLVIGGSGLVFAACSCTATTDKAAECSGAGYTPCNSASCSISISCCPPSLKIDCGSGKYYCNTGYSQVDTHQKCDKTGQANLECYQDGTYYTRVYKDGTCGKSGTCNSPTEDESQRAPRDDYNTRPCT